MLFCFSRSLYVDGSSLQRFVVLSAAMSSLVSFFYAFGVVFVVLRKGLFTCLSFVDCIIFSMSSSNSFNSSIEGGFLVAACVLIFIIYILQKLLPRQSLLSKVS